MISPKNQDLSLEGLTLWWTQQKKVLFAGTLLWRAGALPAVGQETETAPLSFLSFLRGTKEDATCSAPSGDSENRAEAALRSQRVTRSADPQ